MQLHPAALAVDLTSSDLALAIVLQPASKASTLAS
jgi:hypothetical protein